MQIGQIVEEVPFDRSPTFRHSPWRCKFLGVRQYSRRAPVQSLQPCPLGTYHMRQSVTQGRETVTEGTLKLLEAERKRRFQLYANNARRVVRGTTGYFLSGGSSFGSRRQRSAGTFLPASARFTSFFSGILSST